MELSDASRHLIGWELRADMEDHAEVHGQEPSSQILRRIDHRIRRMTQMLVFGLFFVILAMALLIAVLLGGRTLPPDSQTTPAEKALLVSGTPQQPLHLSAFLTAPKNGHKKDPLLEWETTSGIAHCEGFNYSGGHLTVLTDGFYSIAVQITLSNIQGVCTNDQLYMTVSHLTDEYPTFEALLVTYDTMCCKKECKKSLFTSGAFSLKADTVLKVEAFHSGDFNRRQNENEVFFSVYRQA